MLTKLLAVVVSLVLIVAGLIVLPMPIPFGAIMIVSGVVLLIWASAAFALKVKSFRRHHRDANKVILNVEARLPEALRKILRRTNP